MAVVMKLVLELMAYVVCFVCTIGMGTDFFLQWIAAVVLQCGDDDPQKVYVAPSLEDL